MAFRVDILQDSFFISYFFFTSLAFSLTSYVNVHFYVELWAVFRERAHGHHLRSYDEPIHHFFKPLIGFYNQSLLDGLAFKTLTTRMEVDHAGYCNYQFEGLNFRDMYVSIKSRK